MLLYCFSGSAASKSALVGFIFSKKFREFGVMLFMGMSWFRDKSLRE